MATARARASYTAPVTEERVARDDTTENLADAPVGSAPGDPHANRVDSDDGLPSRARRFLRRHRVRLARMALFAFAALVLVDLSGVLPTEVHVVLPLGADHADAVVVAIDVLDESGETARSVRLRFTEGAPASVEQSIELPPGRYTVRLEAERADGSRYALEGPLDAPAEGTVRVPLRRAP